MRVYVEQIITATSESRTDHQSSVVTKTLAAEADEVGRMTVRSVAWGRDQPRRNTKTTGRQSQQASEWSDYR